jgi:adenine-specific DNA-methyltransferase
MARIDELVAEIGDERVRRALAAEVKKLREEKKFGLVFENHIPELSYLYGATVKVGANVVRRGVKGAEVYRVLAVEDGVATIVRDVEGAGETERVAAAELIVVKRYGEAIYPALMPVEIVTKNPSKPYHTIINSDNYHALQLLLYCYESKVDVIYIDPPYNTGARDWKYNNAYVDSNDQWRHSKWLSMLEKRLRLAKQLLKPDGVLIVMIDEHEVHHLGVLLEAIFPNAYQQLVTIIVNPKGVTQGRFSRVEEYANFCFSGNSTVKGIGDDLLTPLPDEEDEEAGAPRWKGLLRSGTNARRQDRKRMFYPVLVDIERQAVLGVGDPLPFEEEPDFDTKIKGLTPIYPVRRDGSLGNWGVGAATLKTLIEKGYVAAGSYDEVRKTCGISYLSQKPQNQIAAGILEVVRYDERRNVVEVRYKDVAERQIKTVWHRTAHDAGAYGSDLLKNVLGRSRSFPFPKSLYAVRDCIASVCRDRKDALILDFFAGSGTTLHATCLLNNVGGGGYNRRAILITNNEVEEQLARQLNAKGLFPGDPEFEKHGICESVTFPRCKYVINGHRDDGTPLPGKYLNGRELAEGFDENLAYFKLDFLDPNEVALGSKFENVLPILWLIAGAQGNLILHNDQEPYYIPDTSPFAVLLKERYFPEFRTALAKRPDITHVFLVTDSPEAFREMTANLGGGRETFMLYKNYLDNFRLNTDRTNA